MIRFFQNNIDITDLVKNNIDVPSSYRFHAVECREVEGMWEKSERINNEIDDILEEYKNV